MDLGLDSRAKNLPLTDTCTSHIWKAIDSGGPLKWARGCKPFGSKRNPMYKCAVYADSQGVGFLLAECLPDNPEGCKMKKPRLRQDKTTDFIWPVETQLKKFASYEISNSFEFRINRKTDNT